MKIVFVGDTHFMSNTPSSRKETPEEYRNLEYSKLRQTYDYGDMVVITGDVFHSSALSMMSGTPKFYNDIIDLMKSKPTYTIVGNHDMYYRNEEVQNITILDNLFKTGVKHLSNVTFQNCGSKLIRLIGVDYGAPFPVISTMDPTHYNIIVAHSFFEDTFYGATGNHNLTMEEVNNKLGQYDAVVLGHDHTAYKTFDFHNPSAHNEMTKVIRPGSLMRGTSHTCQVSRIPGVAVFDTETLEWEYKFITNASGQDVFKEKVILEKDFDISVENIINNMDSYDKAVGIYSFIQEQESRGREVFGDRYDDIIKVITQYLNTFGFIGGNNDNK